MGGVPGTFAGKEKRKRISFRIKGSIELPDGGNDAGTKADEHVQAYEKRMEAGICHRVWVRAFCVCLSVLKYVAELGYIDGLLLPDKQYGASGQTFTDYRLYVQLFS